MVSPPVVKTLRPASYDEVIYVGHYFLQGFAVVMDLTGLTTIDPTPLVDFAAGLVIGGHGSMERVAPGVFLLVPPGVTAGHLALAAR
jgi:cell division inhibitor SepF